MSETLLELQKRLAEAKDARHRLLIGAQEVTVNLHGYGATTYAQGNINALEHYIHELKRDIARKSGSSRRGIMRVSF